MTRRRQILALLVAGWPCVALAQKKTARVGFLWLGSPEVEHLRKALLEALRERGYVEGRNLQIEDRTDAERYEQLLEGARDLVRLNVDVIVTFGSTAARAARSATTTIPIVMSGGTDPVKAGHAASYARPGGNMTGITTLTAELLGKHVQLVRDTLPAARRVAAIVNPPSDRGTGFLAEVQAAGRRLEMEFRPYEVYGAADLEKVFAAAAAAKSDAAFIVPSTLLSTLRAKIVQLALQHRLPLFSYSREWADAGALLAYGISREGMFRRAGDYVDRILKGASPADMAIERPSEFDLAVNLRTAKALGVKIPPTVLLRATRTIE